MNKISIPLVALRSESFTWNGDKYRMLLNDKIIYFYMLSKWEYYNKKGESYTETQPDVAKALNINYHAVNRFVSTAIKLGIIEVVKESRNSMPAYTAIHKVKWDRVVK